MGKNISLDFISDMEDYERLSILINQMQLKAERSCGKGIQHIPFSPTLKESIINIRKCKKIKLLCIQKKHLNPEQEIMVRNANNGKNNITLGDILGHYKLIQKQYRKCKKNATDLREQFLEERAVYYSSIKNQSDHQIIQQIKYTEKIRNVYRKIKMSLDKVNSIQLDHVLVPNGNDEIVNITKA